LRRNRHHGIEQSTKDFLLSLQPEKCLKPLNSRFSSADVSVVMDRTSPWCGSGQPARGKRMSDQVANKSVIAEHSQVPMAEMAPTFGLHHPTKRERPRLRLESGAPFEQPSPGLLARFQNRIDRPACEWLGCAGRCTIVDCAWLGWAGSTALSGHRRHQFESRPRQDGPRQRQKRRKRKANQAEWSPSKRLPSSPLCTNLKNLTSNDELIGSWCKH